MTAWSPTRRTQHRLAMERTAERNRCEVCGRKAALVERRHPDGTRYAHCRWTDEGKCTYSREAG